MSPGLSASLTVAIARVATTAEHFSALQDEWRQVLTESTTRAARIREQARTLAAKLDKPDAERERARP